jgi:hypothetical protein
MATPPEVEGAKVQPVEAMLVVGRLLEVISVLPQPEVGMPELHRPVAGVRPPGTTKLPEVDSPQAIGAQPAANLMDRGRAHPCAKGERAFAFPAQISLNGFGRAGVT